MYASSNMCPDLVNKRLCAFLPLTNCSVPRMVRDNGGIRKGEEGGWSNDLQFFSEASKDGIPVDNRAALGSQPTSAYHKHLSIAFDIDAPPSKKTFSSPRLGAAMGGDGQKVELDGRTGGFANPSPEYVIFPQAFLFRANARYRKLISSNLAEYAAKYRFPNSLSSDCVAIHIRKGDRVGSISSDDPAPDQAEFCEGWRMTRDRKCRRKSVRGSIEEISENECRDRLGDMGCFSRKSFGALTLVDYLEAAATIAPATTSVVIITDDGQWLTNQSSKVLRIPRWSNWSIYPYSARFGRNEQGHETDNGVDFLSSLHLVRQCQSFVGHWWSGFSRMIFEAMCFHRGAAMGSCPAVVDIGRVYHSNGGSKESCFICEGFDINAVNDLKRIS
jgi:hypothetical protein